MNRLNTIDAAQIALIGKGNGDFFVSMNTRQIQVLKISSLRQAISQQPHQALTQKVCGYGSIIHKKAFATHGPQITRKQTMPQGLQTWRIKYIGIFAAFNFLAVVYNKIT